MSANRAFYSASISDFVGADPNFVLGELVRTNQFQLLPTQRDAWLEEISILKGTLQTRRGSIYLEYSIPRMGKRIDAVLLIGPVIFVVEFKIGERQFTSFATDQVCDYALDLKHFHEPSHSHFIAPILVATHANMPAVNVTLTPHNDRLFTPIKCNTGGIGEVIQGVLCHAAGSNIEPAEWETGRYCPTPTIVEAAIALYSGHSVSDISQ